MASFAVVALETETASGSRCIEPHDVRVRGRGGAGRRDRDRADRPAPGGPPGSGGRAEVAGVRAERGRGEAQDGLRGRRTGRSLESRRPLRFAWLVCASVRARPASESPRRDEEMAPPAGPVVPGAPSSGVVYGFCPGRSRSISARSPAGRCGSPWTRRGRPASRAVRHLAPLNGSLHRVQLKAGSPVAAGKTVLAASTRRPGHPEPAGEGERRPGEVRRGVAPDGRGPGRGRPRGARLGRRAPGTRPASRDSGAGSVEDVHSAESGSRCGPRRCGWPRPPSGSPRSTLVKGRADPATRSPPSRPRGATRGSSPIDGVVLKVDRESRVVATGNPSSPSATRPTWRCHRHALDRRRQHAAGEQGGHRAVGRG